jgi:hypothetical protein
MSKFTPGPWKAFYKAKYDEWHISLPVDGSAMRAALFADGIPAINHESDREANAHLIAAAPDMLETLEQIKEPRDRYGNCAACGYRREAGHDPTCWWLKVQEVIAKAEGR